MKNYPSGGLALAAIFSLTVSLTVSLSISLAISLRPALAADEMPTATDAQSAGAGNGASSGINTGTGTGTSTGAIPSIISSDDQAPAPEISPPEIKAPTKKSEPDAPPFTPITGIDTGATPENVLPKSNKPYTQGQAPANSEAKVAELEIRYFGKTAVGQALDSRLNKLETLIFGQAKKGTSTERLAGLEKAIGAAALPDTAETLWVQNKGPAISALGAGKATSPATPGAPKENFATLSDAAVADYNSLRYHACAEKLERCLSLKPGDAMTYLRLGDTLQQLRDNDGAKEAYQACFTIDPFGKLGLFAKNRMLTVAKITAYQSVAPQDTPKVVAHTIAQIDDEAADLSNRTMREGRATAQWRMQLGQIEARKINEQARMDRDSLRANYYGGGYGRYGNAFGFGGGGGGYGGYGGYGGGGGGGAAGEISNMAQIQTSWQRTDARVQANLARQAAANKAAMVNESAANLKNQMFSKQIPGDATLHALGTNLYVRYYGNDTPSYDAPLVPEDPPAAEMRARAQSLMRK